MEHLDIKSQDKLDHHSTARNQVAGVYCMTIKDNITYFMHLRNKLAWTTHLIYLIVFNDNS